jgi:dihydroorotase
VDCIASHHLPQDTDHKVVEFEYAQYGMTGLETAFAAVNTALPSLGMERLVELFSINPRVIFNLERNVIGLDAPASLTLFDPAKKWTVERLQSRSKNSAFMGLELTGKPIGIINKDKVFLNE